MALAAKAADLRIREGVEDESSEEAVSSNLARFALGALTELGEGNGVPSLGEDTKEDEEATEVGLGRGGVLLPTAVASGGTAGDRALIWYDAVARSGDE